MAELSVGQAMPEFVLPDQNGVAFDAKAALAKGPLVVFFYPKDETPVCTQEVCSFRDANGEFLAAGATVVGISSDDVASHKRFADKHQLPYQLLSDEGGAVRERFGVPKAMFGLSEGRVTYVFDRGGVLRHKFSSALRANKHVEEALSFLRAAPQ